MKNRILIVAAGLMILSSCAKDIEFCIDGDMNPAEPGSYTYTWCGANADDIVWNSPVDGNNLSGQSISLDFDHKGTFSLGVSASNKRKDDYQTYTINVGTYEARIEPKECSGLNMTYTNDQLRAYAYYTVDDLDMDLKNGNRNSCVDSTDLDLSTYFSGSIQNSTALVGGFTTLTSNSYVIFVETLDHSYSNLMEIIYTPSNSYLSVNNGEWDDAVYPTVFASSNPYNWISSIYQLTAVWINGTQTTVQPCNADDLITFSLHGTFLYDVGADDCSGGQSSSTGYFNVSQCQEITNGSITLVAQSGSWFGADYISMSVGSNANQIDVTINQGGNQIIQQFTAQ